MPITQHANKKIQEFFSTRATKLVLVCYVDYFPSPNGPGGSTYSYEIVDENDVAGVSLAGKMDVPTGTSPWNNTGFITFELLPDPQVETFVTNNLKLVDASGNQLMYAELDEDSKVSFFGQIGGKFSVSTFSIDFSYDTV